MFPLVLCAAEAGSPQASRRRPWMALGAFFVMAAAYILVRTLVVHPHPDPHPLAIRVLTAPRILAKYLQLLLVPIGMRVYHDLALVSTPGITDFLLPLIVLGSWVGLAVVSLRRAPLVSLGLLWPFLALLPVCGLVVIPQPAPLAERFLYFPSMGIALLAGVAYRRITRSPGWPSLAPAGAAIVLLVLAGMTLNRTRLWHDDVTLMSAMVHDAPHAATGYANLGAALERSGQLQKAAEEDSIAVALSPQDHMFHRNLGLVYAKQGRYRQAREQLLSALAIKPDYADAQSDLAWLSSLQGDVGQARQTYLRTLADRPGDVSALLGMEELTLREGNVAEASRFARLATQASPFNGEAHRRLSALLDAQDSTLRALQEDSLATAYSPGSAAAHYDFGVELSRWNRTAAALAEFKKAVDLQPSWAKAHFNLGAMLAGMGNRQGALNHLRLAQQLAPPDTGLARRAADAIRMVVGQ